MEVWKDVVGFEGWYEVSNLGNVRNSRTGNVLKQKLDKDGYSLVNLGYGKARRSRYVHRLVAFAFIPNPNRLPQVNHKDENKETSRADNLEWCTGLYNVRYGTGIHRSHEHRDNEAMALRLAIPVAQYDMQGHLVSVFPSPKTAEKATGIKASGIRSCTCGRKRTAGGYIWKRAE